MTGLDRYIYLVVVGAVGWIVPGGGHFLIGQRAKGVTIFIGVMLAFGLGIYVGSIGVINHAQEYLWFIPQMMVSPLVKFLDVVTQNKGLECFGRSNEIGQIYTSMAGMLNLLCVVNAVYLAMVKVCARQEETE